MKTVPILFSLLAILITSSASATCLEAATKWVKSKGEDPSNEAQIICEGARENHDPTLCLEQAYQWSKTDTEIKIKVATGACAGESDYTQISTCLDNAWTFFSDLDMDTKRILTGKACGYGSDPSNIRSCLSYSWSDLSRTFKSSVNARYAVTEQCQNKDLFYLDAEKNGKCWRYDEKLNPLYEVKLSMCPKIYVDQGKLLPLIKVPYFTNILNLNEGATIPSKYITEENLEKLSVSIVARRYLNQQIGSESFRTKGDGKSYYDFQKDTAITIFFRDGITSQVLDNGILNHHQTGSSTGNLSGESYESKLLEIKVGPSYASNKDLSHYLRPKYGYLMFKKDQSDIWPSKISNRYGNVAVVLQDHIKNRATFTPDNSYYANPSDIMTFNTQIRYPLRKSRASDAYSGHHWEVQIYGPIGIQKDVDHFLINCPGVDDISSDALDLIIKTGKPVYSCKRTRTGLIANKKIYN